MLLSPRLSTPHLPLVYLTRDTSPVPCVWLGQDGGLGPQQGFLQLNSTQYPRWYWGWGECGAGEYCWNGAAGWANCWNWGFCSWGTPLRYTSMLRTGLRLMYSRAFLCVTTVKSCPFTCSKNIALNPMKLIKSLLRQPGFERRQQLIVYSWSTLGWRCLVNVNCRQYWMAEWTRS